MMLDAELVQETVQTVQRAEGEGAEVLLLVLISCHPGNKRQVDLLQCVAFGECMTLYDRWLYRLDLVSEFY